MSIKSFVLCIGISALSLQCVKSFDEDSIGKLKDQFEPVFSECAPKFGVTKEQLHEALKKHDFSSINTCFSACIFKKTGFMNDKGMFDKDGAIAEVQKTFTEDDAAAASQIAEKCSSVNDASVSDGDGGCDRAKLLLECIAHNKDLFNH